ncbi:hypothetical protein [Streptomyces sp. NBC_01304]|uniref:hypothetical protein n=1 Tax=Streptomyces sp. NBC_01304 TaxID=2903818 RepID=UPI002E0E1E57|nr:hypothetical protein OG430_00240 [Streptomyces sp. NBC_01304]
MAGGNAGGALEQWRIVGRDAVVFPEVVAVADALLDPVMAQLVWVDSGAERPRPLPADGAFCRGLGERVGRPWLGLLAATDPGSPLFAWMGAVVRARRYGGQSVEYADDPWWVRQEHQPATMAGQLRVVVKEKKAPGSGTRWRATVAAEQRMWIEKLIGDAGEQLTQLRGRHAGSTAETARYLLQNLTRSAGLLDRALHQTIVAAVNAGVSLEDVAQWTGLPVEAVAEVAGAHGEDTGE